jgi:hypothetical protein
MRQISQGLDAPIRARNLGCAQQMGGNAMIAAQSTASSFFRQVQEQSVEFDGERFLLEVDAQFGSSELLDEVRWRLEVLHELANQRGLTEAFDGLRDRLTQVFACGGDEAHIVAQLRGLTQIESKAGKAVDLRHFLKTERRLYNEREYREVLQKKIDNTKMHAVNLTAFYADQEPPLRHLGKVLQGLVEKIGDVTVRTRTIKTIEDNIRELPSFQTYEQLKERFLRDWLAHFAGVPEQELALLGEAEVQRLIQEHQRHQTTRLVKAGVRPLDTDVSQYLGIHDTLEAEFHEEPFWEKANSAVKRGFHEWVLQVVRAVGMVNGQRYAFFQSEADESCYLLCGLGLPRLPEPGDAPIRLVPYLKPFTRKAGYLLEIRKRALGDQTAYFQELRHYTLPFLFGCDQVAGLEVPRALRNFVNSPY